MPEFSQDDAVDDQPFAGLQIDGERHSTALLRLQAARSRPTAKVKSIALNATANEWAAAKAARRADNRRLSGRDASTACSDWVAIDSD